MGDSISRRAAIDAIYDTFCYAYCDNCENEELRWEDDSPCEDCHRKYQSWRASRATIERAINSLPSAESDVPDINVGDMRSRQDAIDQLHQSINLLEAEDRMKELPSAQPEIIRCKDCKWGSEVCGNIECFVDGDILSEYHGYEWFCPNGERKDDEQIR